MNLFLPTLQTRNNSIKLAFSKIKKAIPRVCSDLRQTLQEESVSLCFSPSESIRLALSLYICFQSGMCMCRGQQHGCKRALSLGTPRSKG